MANLIITVISIALVAVAAVMGAYYGGSAFMTGQGNAKANQLVAGAEQIAAGATLWTSSTGRIEYEDLQFNFLVTQNYLSSLPNVAVRSSPTSEGFYCNWADSTGSVTECDGGSYKPQNAFVMAETDGSDDTNPGPVCKKIAQMAGGNLAVPRADGIVFPTAGRRFDCVFGVTANVTGWLFIYRID